ncbi:AAA domain-containing protein [Marinobacter sp. M1N3S26]|uniref:AAA domain-containing protein n=1 Tax=Marinobacter sp. M1N3S26 TaxID=3382299 RepID=UPI00387B2C9F
MINGPPGTGKTHTIACQVLDAVINQRSTLVVCSNDQSADVVRDKIAAMLEGAEHVVLRPGRGNYQQDLVDQINQWLEGDQEPPEDEATLARTAERLERTSRRFRHAEGSFFRAVADAERSTEAGVGPSAWLRRWWSALRTWRSPLLTQRWQELQMSISDHQACMHDYLLQQLDARLSGLLANHRDALATLSMALRSRASHRRNERFEALDWSTLTQVFPVWIVSAGDLSDAVPMTTELFDLVIVDEATQCNLPQALPALQRGKRAVIVGDPRQLRHYSFLARKVQEEAVLRHDLKNATLDLDYRSRSLLDYAIDALPHRNALSFLDEHFRSNPMLIDFSNDRFYQKRIKILTTHRQNQPDQPLQTMACPVEEKDNVNLAEVERVVETLHTLINQYRDSSSPPGIGVLGMVRATAMMLEDRITREISLEDISRHQLRVGTPYAFQGDERDIMLVASCAWPGQVHGTQRYLERDDVFNVAITRARQRQVFFHGEGLIEAEPERLASRYVRHGQQFRKDHAHHESTATASDPILETLSTWFANRGLRARPNLPFAGQVVELAVETEEQLVAIDLVGRRDAGCEVGKAWDAARYRLLERAGLVLAPIARQHWLKRRDEVLADLEHRLSIDKHGAPLNQPLKSPLYRRLKELGPVNGSGGPSPAELFDRLHKAGNLVEFWLKQHFAPDELTYQRYNQTRISLLRQAERKLEGICLILESFRELGAPEDLQEAITSRIAECDQAVSSLVNLARELAELGTTDMASTMDELQRLTDRVSDYRLN